jgi:hypothetical protein
MGMAAKMALQQVMPIWYQIIQEPEGISDRLELLEKPV